MDTVYKDLAKRLDTLPNGFPPTDDGADLRLLAHLFTPEEAKIAAQLRLTYETPKEFAARIGGDRKELKTKLKAMLRKGLIHAGRAESGGLGYGLLPFAVGIYEMQHDNMDEELARLFEDYYQQAFVKVTSIEPQIHRVIPVNETIQNDMEVHPYESVVTIVEESQAWSTFDCICRIQKQLVGDPCDHPVEVCMAFSDKPGAFDNRPGIRALTKDEAYATLKIATEAGLVHSVSNSKGGDPYISKYICNCCTCSCGILRGISDLGMANVIARSAFVNTVDSDECAGCELCVDYCQFGALSLRPEDPYIQISAQKCVGCGVCVPQCPEEALSMVRRPEEEILTIPETHDDWLTKRAAARGIDLSTIQ